MPVMTMKISRELLEEIDLLVSDGLFESRSEAVRYAIRVMMALLKMDQCENGMLNAVKRRARGGEQDLKIKRVTIEL